MTPPMDDLEFDRLLTAALAARADPSSTPDLARRAIELAQAEPASIFAQAPALSPDAIRKLNALRRRSRMVALAASILIGLIIWTGALKIANGGYLNDALGLSTNDSSTSTTTTTTSTSISLGVVLTGELLLVALFLLTFSGLAQRPSAGPAAELAMW